MNELETALTQLNEQGALCRAFDDYYGGEHRLKFATEKFRSTFGFLFREFADNLCPAVVDAVADRLKLTGFVSEVNPLTGTPQLSARWADAAPQSEQSRAQVFQLLRQGDADLHGAAIAAGFDEETAVALVGAGEVVDAAGVQLAPVPAEPAPADPLGKTAWNIWNANRMDLRAGTAHLEALKTGNAYVIVWPDPETGVPMLYPQKGRLVTVAYDEERPGRILWAAKGWVTSERKRRVTLYYPDRVEKYVSRQSSDDALPILKAGAFDQFRVEGEPWPLENPWGEVPVFHFANNAGIGEHGISELRDVIPLQDALNKSVLDMLVAMEFVAFPQRWATGIEIPEDEGGQERAPFTPGVDRLWTSDKEGTRFGQFPQADLEPFLKVQDGFRLEIARVTGTPLHYIMLLSGAPPSGEALKTLEARLVKKCQDRQTGFGNTWEDALELAVRMVGGVRRGSDE
jgi:hypothetical protein